jgi:hypothetical protein
VREFDEVRVRFRRARGEGIKMADVHISRS